MVTQLINAGHLGDFWNILREVNPNSIIQEGLAPVRVVVCGAPESGQRALAAELTAGAEHLSETVVDVYDMPDDASIALPTADMYIYVSSQGPSGVQRDHVRQLQRRPGVLTYLFYNYGEHPSDKIDALREDTASALGLAASQVLWINAQDRRALSDQLGPALFRAAPQLAFPLGRLLPVLRPAAADHLVREASRVNAEFALVSSLPTIVPIVGSLAAAGADMIVLTKNQAMLLLKLAVLNRRSIDNRAQMFAEILPVVGAGFFWRSAARTLVSFLPGPLGIAPRGAVAYVGTYVAGKVGEYYYRSGRRPSPELLDGFRREAMDQLGTVAPLFAGISRRFRL